MMSKTCQNCFYENPDSRQTCEVCGTVLSNDLPSQSQGNVKGGNVLSNLKRIRNGYLLFIFSTIIGIAIEFILIDKFNYFSIFGPFGSISVSSSTNGLTGTVLMDVLIVIIVPGVVTIAGYLLINSGFRGISHLRVGIQTGATGALLTAIGLIIIFLSIAPVLSVLLTTGASTINTNSIGLLLLFALLLLVGAILILVGVIMLAIGLFRLGASFGSGSVKAGAVVAIFLGIIGFIIILLGLESIIRRIGNSPSTGSGNNVN